MKNERGGKSEKNKEIDSWTHADIDQETLTDAINKYIHCT